MIKKGANWVDRMKTGKLPRRDAWMSAFAQLLPGINWGLLAVVIAEKALQKCYQDLYYKMLPLIGVNRNIRKKRKGLCLKDHQGLGLQHFDVHTRSKKIHFLQRNWDGSDSTNKMVAPIYRAIMFEVAMNVNIFFSSWEYFN